jgi:quercetin dioxygenase-like cupin family protein
VDEPGRLVDLASAAWSDDQPDIRSRPVESRGQRWAIVEYESGAERGERCTDGHRGYVLSGRIEYVFDDGETLEVSEGNAFWLAAGQGHRGRNPGPETARLFLIDD